MPESLRANFASFYRATLIPLRRYLARMLRNPGDAEDLAHDAHVRIYESMEVTELAHAINDGAKVRAYHPLSQLDNFEWNDGFTAR